MTTHQPPDALASQGPDRLRLFRGASDGWSVAELDDKTRDACRAVRFVYKNMIHRCHNAAADNYKYYGGRGIKVCQRWRDSIVNFALDMGPRPYEETLDRINNDGDYEPGNCRWASRVVQARNKTGLICITINGETKCPSAWAKDRRCKVTRAALRRLNRDLHG